MQTVLDIKQSAGELLSVVFVWVQTGRIFYLHFIRHQHLLMIFWSTGISQYMSMVSVLAKIIWPETGWLWRWTVLVRLVFYIRSLKSQKNGYSRHLKVSRRSLIARFIRMVSSMSWRQIIMMSLSTTISVLLKLLTSLEKQFQIHFLKSYQEHVSLISNWWCQMAKHQI